MSLILGNSNTDIPKRISGEILDRLRALYQEDPEAWHPSTALTVERGWKASEALANLTESGVVTRRMGRDKSRNMRWLYRLNPARESV